MKEHKNGINRKQFLAASVAAGGVVLASGWWLKKSLAEMDFETSTFIHRVSDYGKDLRSALLAGFKELDIGEANIKGKKILLKPNLVEPHPEAPHINTNPLLVRAAVEAFLHLGAAQVAVAEGPGHRTDTLLVLDESGFSEILREDRIRFIDLNYDKGIQVANRTRLTRLNSLTFPISLAEFDILVSMPKMKTHHWVGATLAMKNMFGVMPGSFYGWPKNVFHYQGIERSICDINAAMPPQISIVDGIVGMEGDGPIMGDAKQAGVIVMGRSAPAVDATCARIMGIDPNKLKYLKMSEILKLGVIAEKQIQQLGESITSVRTDFKLLDFIHAQRGIRLA